MSLFLFLMLACTSTPDDSGTMSDPSDGGADSGATVPALDFPAWAWQHWVWEDESTQDSVIEMVDGYAQADIPVAAVIIDSPWETAYNDFQWDPARFPDPDALIAELHDRDIRVMLWIVPAINVDAEPLYSEWAANGWFMQYDADSGPAVIDWWKGEGSLIDYWNPDAVDAWHTLMQPILDQGIDGWKCDGLDFSAIAARYSPAAGRDVERAEYSERYYRDFYETTRDRLGEDRIITARPVDNYGAGIGGAAVAFAPHDTLVAGWVGDQDASFDGIRAALDNYYWSADLGYLAFGSDIGGYRDDSSEPLGRSREVFLRWAQLGAFSPVMENGGGGDHWPWRFDEAVTAAYRQLVELHHALVPWMREKGAKARAEGRSLLAFVDRKTYAYVLGDDIFFAPVIEDTDDGETATLEVTLPEGEDWRWLSGDGRTFPGGTHTTLTLALDEFAGFVRVGSDLDATLAVR